MSDPDQPFTPPTPGTIVPPIFVDPELPLLFESVAEAEEALEPTELGADEKGYDSEGRLLRVRVIRPFGMGAGGEGELPARVEITAAEREPTHLEDLRLALASWLGRTSTPRRDLSQAPLQELIERARARASLHTGKSGIAPILDFVGVVMGLFLMPVVATPVEWLHRLGREAWPEVAGPTLAKFLTYLPIAVASVATGLVVAHAAACAIPLTRTSLLGDAGATSLGSYVAKQRNRLRTIGLVVVAALAVAVLGAWLPR